jgi:hypothetical protein
MPLLAGTHHALLADLLGSSLRAIQLVHRSTGVAMSLLCLLHILIAVASRVSFSLDNLLNQFAVIVVVYTQVQNNN